MYISQLRLRSSWKGYGTASPATFGRFTGLDVTTGLSSSLLSDACLLDCRILGLVDAFPFLSAELLSSLAGASLFRLRCTSEEAPGSGVFSSTGMAADNNLTVSKCPHTQDDKLVSASIQLSVVVVSLLMFTERRCSDASMLETGEPAAESIEGESIGPLGSRSGCSSS